MNNRHGIPDHLFAKDLGDDGVSWTLSSRAGIFLRELQERYGPRDRSWTYVGLDFWEGRPMIWYPGGYLEPHPKNIGIHLSAQAFSNHKEAMYQLSHECVHLLAPSGGNHAPVMEEGLAKLYSMEIIMRLCDHPRGQDYGNFPAYSAAASSVLELLNIDNEGIRKLRAVQPAFYKMTPETFAEAGLQVPAELIAELLKPF
ncbi:hypothetical protein ACN5LO_004020 [Cronobacter sakazakii]|uniref:hypothetical protein n=1 Tax=Cronobacter dublinensis TaxID=413497 RepID=UPI0024AD84BB|nr:hypothetical protein [Cronobacter dublinensis]MDI6447172.1 hypothetical protein [Cronobacter dublinensis]